MTRDVQLLAKDIYFGECPRWRDGRLWFSDFFGRAVHSISLAGDLQTEFTLDDQPSGLGWLPDGDLLVVAMLRRRVLRRTPNGDLSVHAELGDIATYHCNDMIVDAQGRAYVGNFGFDLEAAVNVRGMQGVLEDHPTATLALVTSDGVVSAAAPDMHFPNGGALAPDGRTLIIAETLSARLTAFTRQPDGSLTDRRVWASLGSRIPDGIALDAHNRVWFANPVAPECVLVAEGGEVVDIVPTGQPCFACALGGPDGKTLFMLTAPGSGSHASIDPPRGQLLMTSVEIGAA
jgi:sugar lactone lactonase YvrE